MGKKRSAARRAAATAAVAPAATPRPAVPFDTHAALVDTPPAPAVRESPTTTQQSRVSHEADATRAPRAASPTQPTINATLICEPAASDARADTSVAIATPQALVAHAFEPCPEPDHSPPALTTPTSTSSDVSANSPQQPRVSNHANTITVLRPPFPALSALAAAAAADLAGAIDVLSPPTVFLVCPTHSSCRAEDFGHELDTRAPRTCPATSIEDIDEGLLANIIEDAQNQTRIDARREVRVKALQEGREQGWKEGLEEGRREARREARRDANTEMRQQEQGWKDAYESGRWAGYHEGLEVARTEVSTRILADAIVQADDVSPAHSLPTDTTAASSRLDIGVQADAPTTPHPLLLDMDSATSHVNAATQMDDPTPTSHIDTGVQAEDPAPTVTPSSPPDDTHFPHPRVHASTQTDTPRSSAPARAKIVQEIEPGLLTEILAKAIARGEATGLTKGKHVGFQEGIEAGMKSGLKEGRKQALAEVSNTSRAAAVVQTDDVEWPTCVDSINISRDSSVRVPSTCIVDILHPIPLSNITHSHEPAPLPNTSMSTDDLSLSHNDADTSFTTAHTHIPSFSWADEACSLPTMTLAPLISPPPRDFSILRSSSTRPFDSLKRRARRSQARPTRFSHPPQPFIPTSEPVITRRHPAGLRTDRPSVIVSSSPLVPNSVKLEAPPLDWQGDPRLQELGRVLRGLGWIHVSGS